MYEGWSNTSEPRNRLVYSIMRSNVLQRAGWFLHCFGKLYTGRNAGKSLHMCIWSNVQSSDAVLIPRKKKFKIKEFSLSANQIRPRTCIKLLLFIVVLNELLKVQIKIQRTTDKDTTRSDLLICFCSASCLFGLWFHEWSGETQNTFSASKRCPVLGWNNYAAYLRKWFRGAAGNRKVGLKVKPFSH